MNKNILIKVAITLIVVVLVYSVFWFFKVGQVEKQINKFISENSAYVSAGEVSVSGFPFSQKISVKDLKFSVPNALLDKKQVVVKHLEATSGVLSSDFTIALIEPVTLQDVDGNIFNVEFNKDPEIVIAISEGRIAKMSYSDLGYRVVDASKAVIYAASSSSLSLETSVGEGEKIVTKIIADVKDIEGFDIIDVYKNVLEKKVVDGLKTGEIVINNNPSAVGAPAAAPVALSANSDVSAVSSSVSTEASVAAISPVVVAPPASANPVEAAQVQDHVASSAANITPPVAPTPSAAPSAEAEQLPATVTDSSIVKSNFTLDLEYSLIPTQGEQVKIPLDPTQVQEISSQQYSKNFKIVNAEFSNPLYKVTVNGEMNTFSDDNLPSGGISIKIEKIDNLLGQINTGLTQIFDKNKPADQQNLALVSGMPADDSYNNFLKKLSENLAPISKELAAKNALSKEDVTVFDVRREKNMEFLLNETPMREVLGKI